MRQQQECTVVVVEKPRWQHLIFTSYGLSILEICPFRKICILFRIQISSYPRKWYSPTVVWEGSEWYSMDTTGCKRCKKHDILRHLVSAKHSFLSERGRSCKLSYRTAKWQKDEEARIHLFLIFSINHASFHKGVLFLVLSKEDLDNIHHRLSLLCSQWIQHLPPWKRTATTTRPQALQDNALKESRCPVTFLACFVPTKTWALHSVHHPASSHWLALPVDRPWVWCHWHHLWVAVSVASPSREAISVLLLPRKSKASWVLPANCDEWSVSYSWTVSSSLPQIKWPPCSCKTRFEIDLWASIRRCQSVATMVPACTRRSQCT
jgi:hypothetical protein